MLAEYDFSNAVRGKYYEPPGPRAQQTPSDGRIVAVPYVVGLHHHYERRAA
jgi:hypothetical protein